MSIKKLIFFQIDTNNTTDCSNDASKDNIVKKSAVKTESPVQN